VVCPFIDRKHFFHLGHVTAWRRAERGVEFDVDGERFRVEVLRPDVVRLAISRDGRFDERPTHAVCREDPAPVAFEVEETAESVRLCTEQLRVVVSKPRFGFEAFRASARPGVHEFEIVADPGRLEA
jgi:alpha-glucosidase